MNPHDIRHFLELNGWELKEQDPEQNLFIFKHPTIKGEIILPFTHEILPPSVLDAILKKAGLKK